LDYKFKKRFTLILIAFIVSTSIFSQNFKGVVSDFEGKPINDCYILLVDSVTNEVLNYAIPNDKGEYFININGNKLTKIRIKCQGIAYNTKSKYIEIKNETDTYNINFTLTIKENKLDEVIIISERIAVKVKNDTVEYDVSKFRHIEDGKIINVLKKMPGIQVNEKTGLIQYKGKPIETLLLDGDDLFGKNYSIGARNIPSDLVDKVEAIEDYHYNKLKKGLKKSDKVVINLKFKKNKSKISGEISVGVGKGSHLANGNIINLSHNIKSFGVFNINNISINQTSFQEDTYASENREEIENSSIDFFKESSITQTSSFPRSYINNIRFGTFSNLFKLSDKIILKNSISYFNDINKYSFFSRNDIIIDDKSFQTSNKTSNTAQPVFVSMKNEIDIDLSGTSILKYSNRLVSHKNTFSQSNLQNMQTIFETQINQSKFYFQQKLNYTKKLSNSDLIEINLFNSNDNRKQSLKILNQQDIIFDNENFDNERKKISGEILYLKKVNKFNFEITANNTYDSENFIINTNSEAYNYHFKNNTSELSMTTNFEKNKKLRLISKFNLGYSQRELLNSFDNEKISKNGLFTNSDIKLKLKFNNKSSLTLNFENINMLNDHYYLFSNPILIDSRTIINSVVSLNLKRKWKSYMYFSHYNLLKQSSFSFLSSYEEKKNSFVAEQNMNKDINIITFFQTPQTIKDIYLSSSKSFFLDIINNKIILNVNTSFSRYFNALNGNAINEVRSSVYNTNIEINSAFEGFFNYKSSIGFTLIKNKQQNTTPFLNNTLNARLETIFKFGKKTYCKIENELIIPKGSVFTKNKLFVDFTFNHRSKSIKYFILARNLLNKSSFNQIYVTEFSKSVFSKNLFDRYIVFGLNYMF